METMPRGYNLSCLCSNPKCNAVFSARTFYTNDHKCPQCGQRLYDSCIVFGFTEQQSYLLANALSREREAQAKKNQTMES